MNKFLLLLLFVSAPIFAADNGLVSQPSPYTFSETVSKFEAVLKSKGLIVFAKVDHSGEAEKVGIKMRPTQLIIFGNPKAGTPVMLASPTMAIDLPLKVLIAEDDSGKVLVTFNSPAYLQTRHGVKDDLLKNISAAATLVDLALK